MPAKDATDIEELRVTASQTVQFLIDKKWSKHKALEVVQALCESTIDKLDNHVHLKYCTFNSSKIAAVTGRLEGNSEADSRWLRGHIDSYHDFIASHREELAEHLAGSGVRQFLKISSSGSQGGNRNHFYIELESAADTAAVESDAGSTNTASVISYQLRHLPKPRAWLRPILNFELISWRFYVYLGLPLAISLVALVWFEWIFLSREYNQISNLTLYMVGMYLLWMFFGPYYALLTRRISDAPWWVIPFSVPGAQLEMQPTLARKKNGSPVRKIRLVRYGADCLVCGAPVHIVKGSGEFRGRLIGQCHENGVEHIYSFDQISKKGVPLRGNAFFGAADTQYGKYYIDECDSGSD